MSRSLRLVLTAATAIALGWGGLWLAVRTLVVVPEIDRGLAALAADGLSIDIGRREIGGFPLGYGVHVEDVTLRTRDGAEMHLPHLSATSDLLSPGTFVVRLPERFEVRARPGIRPVEIETEDATVSLGIDTADGQAHGLDLSARRLMIVAADPDAGEGIAIDMAEVTGRATAPGDGEIGLPSGELRILRADLSFAAHAEDGSRIEGTAAAEDVLATAQTTVFSARALAEVADGSGAGRAEATVAARQLSGDALAIAPIGAGGATPEPERLSAVIGAPSAVLTLDRGALDARAGLLRAEVWTDQVATAAHGDGPPDAAARAGGPSASEAATAGAPQSETPVEPRGHLLTGPVEARHLAPVAPTAEMQPVALALRVQGVRPDEALWERLDPGARLPREPGQADIALSGTARVIRPLSERRPGEAPPVEFGNVLIDRMSVSGLGATAEATGAIEMLPGILQPVGRIEVTLAGVIGLLRLLGETGMLEPTEVQTAAAALAVYTRADGAPDRLRADIDMDARGIRVNGAAQN